MTSGIHVNHKHKLCGKCGDAKLFKFFNPHPFGKFNLHNWCQTCREDFRAICNPKYRKKLFLDKEQKRLMVNRLRRDKYKER